MRDRICDALMLAVVFVFYGGIALAVGGLCLARWGLCWMGLMLAAIAITVISVARVMDDLRNIAKHNAPRQAVLMGLQVAAEAVVCIFLYLAVMPVAICISNLVGSVKKLKCE